MTALPYGATKSKPAWQTDKDWSDKFLPSITKILKQCAMYLLSIEIASQADDAERATDLIIKVKGGDVAVRIRRDGYRQKYRDWTIRSYRASGSKTELAKLREGFARWYLYLWTNEVEIVDWILIDLDIARSSGVLYKERKHIPNGDGTYFVAVSPAELRKNDCLIAEKRTSPAQLSFI